MDNIKLSVRELVDFVYKSGDISTGKMTVDRAMEGIKAHKILQSQMGESYKKEFFLKYEFEYKNIIFTVEGRADGIMTDDGKVTVDEIKSTYANLDDIGEIYNLAHLSQAKCYAYIYAVQNDINEIYMQMRYYNIDTEQTKILPYKYRVKELEEFFYELINSYISWAETLIDMKKIRKETVDNVTFPFDTYREGQREFSVAVFRAIKSGKKLFAQAPTGVGKTISVIFPAIKALNEKENSKIFYLTAKSSTKDIAFDTVKTMYDRGLKLKTVILTAKEKICFQDECNCDGEYCKYSKGYYDKINEIIQNTVKTECMYSRQYIENICRQYEICPFEFSLDLSYMSDIVICDYNYYFDPKVSLQRDDYFNNTNDIILVDEAHNLEDRARNMYSQELVKEEFLSGYKLMKDINKKIYKELKNINSKFIEIRKLLDQKTAMLADEPIELIKCLRKFIIECEIYINDNKKNEEAPKELIDLYFKSLFFIKISEIADDNFCYYVDFDGGNTKVKLFLIDPSQKLKETEKKAWATIFFSATLTPLKYFRYILGGDEDDYIMRIKSPFDCKNQKLMIASDISMKYTQRDANIERLCQYINLAVNKTIGNYMVFFPSYAYMNKVKTIYDDMYGIENIEIHSGAMSEEEQKSIVEKFKTKQNMILFTVVGGIFSEGIDLPLEKLIGTVIIGTGIPQISFERNIVKNFFDIKFNQGFDFAYKYPGFNKILQSAGRVIRTEKDKGVVLLVDSRLSDSTYVKLFPEHWKYYKKIYRPKQFEDECIQFWSEEINEINKI